MYVHISLSLIAIINQPLNKSLYARKLKVVVLDHYLHQK